MDQVIVNQPSRGMIGAGMSMSYHGSMKNAAICPPGMELLLGTSMILVHQLVEMVEAFTGFDTNNRYEVLDMGGRRMFLAAEHSNVCLRFCMRSNRPFTILIVGNHGGVCLKIQRQCSCCYCLCGGTCCNEVHVTTAGDVLIGKIKQDCCEICGSRFTIYDTDDKAVLKIKGPCRACMCCSVHFKVCNMEGNEIGEIHKKWGGVIKEAYTTADTFGVTFPLEMDPRHKTLMLGAVFLIDFMFFEHSDHK